MSSGASKKGAPIVGARLIREGDPNLKIGILPPGTEVWVTTTDIEDMRIVGGFFPCTSFETAIEEAMKRFPSGDRRLTRIEQKTNDWRGKYFLVHAYPVVIVNGNVPVSVRDIVNMINRADIRLLIKSDHIGWLRGHSDYMDSPLVVTECCPRYGLIRYDYQRSQARQTADLTARRKENEKNNINRANSAIELACKEFKQALSDAVMRHPKLRGNGRRLDIDPRNCSLAGLIALHELAYGERNYRRLLAWKELRETFKAQMCLLDQKNEFRLKQMWGSEFRDPVILAEIKARAPRPLPDRIQTKLVSPKRKPKRKRRKCG